MSVAFYHLLFLCVPQQSRKYLLDDITTTSSTRCSRAPDTPTAMCISCPHVCKRGLCKCRYMAPHSASHRLLGIRYQALGHCYGLLASASLTATSAGARLFRGRDTAGQVSSTRVCLLCSFCRAAKAATACWPHSQLPSFPSQTLANSRTESIHSLWSLAADCILTSRRLIPDDTLPALSHHSPGSIIHTFDTHLGVSLGCRSGNEACGLILIML